MNDRKQRALIKQWRQAANEATVADSAVTTYTECADALEAAIAGYFAMCEGCGAKAPMLTERSLPAGWSQCGVSKRRHAGKRRLASWCPTCRVKRPKS